jgi:FkbM family methyltransferase
VVNGKIVLPEWVKHVKLDIGLGRFPIYSREWLKEQPDTIIFGFEPSPDALRMIRENWIISKEQMGRNFFVLPVALAESSNTFLDFYETSPSESSSLLKPTQEFLDHYKFKLKFIQVPCFTLADFLQMLPKVPFIEYIKIDAQGADLSIVRSGHEIIKDKVVYITLEADGNHYEKSDSTPKNIDAYMNSIGFERIQHPNTDDPTYFNQKFEDAKDSIYICQRVS